MKLAYSNLCRRVDYRTVERGVGSGGEGLGMYPSPRPPMTLQPEKVFLKSEKSAENENGTQGIGGGPNGKSRTQLVGRCSTSIPYSPQTKSQFCALGKSSGLLLTCFRYLLIACDTAINIYSTSTSVLVRRLRTRHSGLVSGFAFSSTHSDQLYISTQAGLQEKWDWINGIRLESWNTKVPIHVIRAAPPDGAAAVNGLVYTIDRHTRERWLLTAHRLLGGQEAAKTDLMVLLVYKEPLTSLKILDDGNVIVATSGTKVIIGTTEAADKQFLKDIVYVWREIECSEWITSIDVQVEHADPPVRPQKPHSVGNGLNIVVGGLKGAIFIYENILRKLINKETSSKTSKREEINPRRLHWHRNAVAAVKWSADGELRKKFERP